MRNHHQTARGATELRQEISSQGADESLSQCRKRVSSPVHTAVHAESGRVRLDDRQGEFFSKQTLNYSSMLPPPHCRSTSPRPSVSPLMAGLMAET